MKKSKLQEKYDNFKFVKEQEHCWVYIFINLENNAIKIGYSENIYTRLRHIRSSSGNKKIEILLALWTTTGTHYKDPAAIELEKFLHFFYKEKKIHGEWFGLNIRDLIDIRNLFYEIEGEELMDNFKEILLKNENN